ncbi:hypothetical protein PMAYCL1PPCAC_05190 [Pristionchus mayeri]|uniref:Uncharacterized protein n=1 Tax=Pristionchus mayeri TaxID=1317129 RepID=A0AAN4ZDH3_9BILA|nr:hypothetical protein PMAYCL1PPCAC_05190 [Pristionchus mayeri]
MDGKGVDKSYKQRDEVLQGHVAKFNPILLELIEIQDNTRRQFAKFAADILGYVVMAISYPICEPEETIERAAAILVRKDAFMRNRFVPTITRACVDGKFSIAAVHDTIEDVHHVCCYIHHADSTANKSKKALTKNKIIESNKNNFNEAISEIKRNRIVYVKERSEFQTNLQDLRIVVSGDLNLYIPAVVAVLDKSPLSFLEDKLHPNWHTRVLHYHEVSKSTFTKIDYILGHNISTKIHQPIYNDYDHLSIVSDIYFKGCFELMKVPLRGKFLF